jgi:hypothetical protein
MIPRHALSVLASVLGLALAACDRTGSQAAVSRTAGDASLDPVIARALNDPLMSDPDLAMRSEANAVLSYADSVPLPVIEATSEAVRRAREAARTVLIEGGPIPPLSPLAAGPAGAAWDALEATTDILAAAGVPEACRAAVRDGFVWTARLDAPAAIMPHGMALRAAGSDTDGCRVRLVRYLTAASIEDALIFHDTLAQRAGFAIWRHVEPEVGLAAKGKPGEGLHLRARPAAGGMNAVDLVFWTTP